MSGSYRATSTKPWSSNVSSLNANDLERLRGNLEGMEKKTKTRILTSLVSLDGAKREDMKAEVKALLSTVYDGSDEGEQGGGKWIKVLVGMINERLYGDDTVDDMSNSIVAKRTLQDTSDSIAEKIIAIENSLNVRDKVEQPEQYLLPLEYKFLDTPEFANKKSDGNPHFSFSDMAPPNIMAREEQRLAQHNKKMAASASSLNIMMASSSRSSQASKSQSNASGDKRKSMSSSSLSSLASLAVANKKRAPMMLSLSDVKNASAATVSKKKEKENQRSTSPTMAPPTESTSPVLPPGGSTSPQMAPPGEGDDDEGNNNDDKDDGCRSPEIPPPAGGEPSEPSSPQTAPPGTAMEAMEPGSPLMPPPN